MNGIIARIAAEADEHSDAVERSFSAVAKRQRKFSSAVRPEFPLEGLPTHQFPAKKVEIETQESQAVAELPLETITQALPAEWCEDPLDRDPDLWLYRKRTIALLRKYLRYSLETGRLPSILGSEFFRSHVTSYGVSTFEDRVVFVHDVEICLQKLDAFAQKVIGCVVLQEHSHDSAARRLHCTRKTVERTLYPALDELSEQFLAVGMLVRVAAPELVQEDEFDEEGGL